MEIDDLGKDYPEGEVIFREGDPGDCMYIIQKGKVKITKNTPEGDIHVTTLREGEIFGEMSLFDGHPRSATATSLGRSRILTLDRRMFFTNISRDPTIAFKIMQAMSDRIRRLIAVNSRLRVGKFDIMKNAHDLEETCRTILAEARDMVDADNGSIMLLEKDGMTLRIAGAFGQEYSEKISLKTGEGIAGKVLESGEAQMINNVACSAVYKKGEAEFNSIMCVPLMSDTGKLGILNLSTITDKLFSLQDLSSIQLLATYSSIALQNVLQFIELKNAADGLRDAVREFGRS